MKITAHATKSAETPTEVQNTEPSRPRSGGCRGSPTGIVASSGRAARGVDEDGVAGLGVNWT